LSPEKINEIVPAPEENRAKKNLKIIWEKNRRHAKGRGKTPSKKNVGEKGTASPLGRRKNTELKKLSRLPFSLCPPSTLPLCRGTFLQVSKNTEWKTSHLKKKIYRVFPKTKKF
jgi:hypothetical protein